MEAVSRRRGDSSPGIMAVGGFFVHFGVIPGATRSVSRSTGETSSTAPLSGHRRLYVAAVRQSTRGRRDGGPGRLEQLGRARPADGTGDVVAVRSARTASSAVNRHSYAIDATLRRNATPCRYCITGLWGMPCFRRTMVKRAAVVASWSSMRDPEAPPLVFVIDAARLSSELCQGA